MEQGRADWQSKYTARIKAERETKLKRGMNELLNRRFKSKRRNVTRTALIVIAILVTAFSYVLLRETKLVRQRYDNAELTEKITDLKLKNESKKEQLAKLFDAKTLSAKAREIGLEKASQDQIISIPVPQINQLSINLQSANAINYEKSGEVVDFKLIYKNLADYFETLNSKQAKSKDTTDNSVQYGLEAANGILLRHALEIDQAYVDKVKENANQSKQSEALLAKKIEATATKTELANSQINQTENVEIGSSSSAESSEVSDKEATRTEATGTNG